MTEPDGRRADAYTSEVTTVVLAEAADVIRAAGFAQAHLVVIGGLVPSLLVPFPDGVGAPHLGTADIDLCVSMAFIDGDTEEYDRLEHVLVTRGFSVADASFRWVRETDPRITLEFFCPASAERPAGQAHRPRASDNPTAKHNFGGRLSALALDAGETLVRDSEIVPRRIELPRSGGTIDMDLHVTGPLGFLVAKSAALQGRDKPKDAYDIVWLLESWPGGPASAAAAWADRPAYSAAVEARVRRLGQQFADTGSFGAVSYSRFVDPPGGTALAARQAVGAVQEFLGALRPAH